MTSLKNIFYPKSVCVVGASSKEKSIGYELLKTIKVYGYAGKVFPVNPKSDELLGYKCYHSIEEIDDQVDLAVVVVPKQFVEESVDDLLRKKVKSIILITAGFKEIGKDGEETENRIVEKIKRAGARMVGPNCMGVINTLAGTKLNATFVAEKPETGSTGFLSQSGALGAAVLNSLRETDIKFAHFISVGNKADINENDILNFWQNDDNIKTLTFYLESFVNGADFITPIMAGKITKPVLVLKTGRTESGMKAASSHTGALSSSDKVVDALLNQFGIIRSENLNELFNTAKGFENFSPPKGNKIAVVTNAGGPAILCVDSLEKENLVLASLNDKTKQLLRAIVHPEGSVENPVDLLPGGNSETFKKVTEIVSSDENVDAVISIFVEPVMVAPVDVIEAVYSIKSEKPILQVVMPLPEFWNEYRLHSTKKLPLFRNPEDPPKVLSNMQLYKSSLQKLAKNKNEYTSLINLNTKKNNFVSGFLSQDEVNQLCADYNLPVIESWLIETTELEKVELDFFPLVLKGLNKNVVHKSELRAVKLNINNRTELISSATEIEQNFSSSGFAVEEFLVQRFVSAKHELLIGGFRDPSFGPVIMFGSGGKYVEVLDDTAIKSCYLCDNDIESMINSTKIGKIFHGVRGEAAADLTELKRIIKQCAMMMLENKNIIEFDVNPLMLTTENKFYAVDIRVRVE